MYTERNSFVLEDDVRSGVISGSAMIFLCDHEPFAYFLFAPHSILVFRHYILTLHLLFLLSFKLKTIKDIICLYCVSSVEWDAVVGWGFESLVIL